MRRSTVVLLALLGGCHPDSARDPGLAEATPPGWVLHQMPALHPSKAYAWLEIILEASARSVERFSPRPTILSREMAIAATAMYDAWAAYDDRAVGTRLGGRLRRPPAERTLANREKAIAHAVHRALCFLYPEDREWIDGQLR
ncbi:MAG TPA: hypothetical protein VEN81_09760, partial [Planctomycetota bacterium]|nr:hypothetical protein [Planctomycetota bacterium]